MPAAIFLPESSLENIIWIAITISILPVYLKKKTGEETEIAPKMAESMYEGRFFLQNSAEKREIPKGDTIYSIKQIRESKNRKMQSVSSWYPTFLKIFLTLEFTLNFSAGLKFSSCCFIICVLQNLNLFPLYTN